jgi:hypothetical protein
VPDILKHHRIDISSIRKRLDRIDHKLTALLIDDPAERKRIAQILKEDEDAKND